MVDSSELTQILQHLIMQSEKHEIKADLREVKNVVLKDHKERLRRLEECMRRAS